jgi:thiamine pyrophosphokinase
MDSTKHNSTDLHALVIANGTLPGLEIIDSLTASADVVICADGGANLAKEIGILPNLIIGDFDSITAETLIYFKNIRQIEDPDQNTTDLEKSILYCINNGIGSADVNGASGDRIDHTTASLGCFKKFGDRISLRMIDSAGELTRINKEVHLSMSIGEKLSLIPVDRCTGIRTQNLKYLLYNETLEIGTREGVSNSAVAKNVSISVEHGTLLLYRFHRRSNSPGSGATK